MKSCAAGWKTALSGQPQWRARLNSQALQPLDAQGRAELLDELLPKLAWYVRGRPQISQRIEGLRDRARRGAEAKWRLEV